ncbi:MAG: SUMF1/EgtB/PvdO family nonheme iron enzyme, partial [Planctomycetes bacterium]|nr:SUMF1/EgtB/PvdO family nonheme iron enzyme [Planctomycetota bacterium]
DGVNDDTVKVRVFAVEMVFVPTASFYVGDGTTNLVQGQFHYASSTTTPFQITSEEALTLGGTAPGNVGNNSRIGMTDVRDDFDNVIIQTLPESFPKGYSAFYCMKYEITQEQYADFLNCLTSTQAATRNPAASTNRYSITGSHPNFSSSTPFVACNFLSWMDGAAYADWAALRPMTELEFEKACRGNQFPVANEFAWGTTGIAGSVYTLVNAGAANEGIATNYATTLGDGNISYNITDGSINGPLRVGIFSGNANNTTDNRVRSGAGFYGVMEMSGNLFERSVTIGNSDGRDFTGTLGDGTLSANGNATNSDWPGEVGGEVTGASGSGFRGGSWNNNSTNARVSDRNNASNTNTNRNNNIGFRCVRPGP